VPKFPLNRDENGETPRPVHFSAGVIVLRCMAGFYHYLLLRAYRHWDFPKGTVEPGEPPFAAARREVLEESGISTLEFRWGESYFDTVPYRHGKVARYYLAISRAEDVVLGINPALGTPEHHEYRWADYATALHLLVPRLQAALNWARAIAGDRC
jgi:bis(5'-nucleosidyl)-tetraphosphatase